MQDSSTSDPHHWLITGANGNLGRRLIGELLAEPGTRVTAVVRSNRARQMIESMALPEQGAEHLTIEVLDYTDVQALRAASRHCDRAVHLVGILKESRQASYSEAHEQSTAALLDALQGSDVEHLTYLSIVGSTPTSGNACLASKGRAEALCRRAQLATCVLRVPMVLGEGDYASFALSRRAAKSTSFTFRADSVEQPIYAGDVVRAIIAAGAAKVDTTLDLGGPQALTREALTQRAAALMGKRTKVVSLPLALGLAVATVLSALLANPPFTPAMLEVLDHDDAVEPDEALRVLGMTGLTSLDDMLAAVLTP